MIAVFALTKRRNNVQDRRSFQEGAKGVKGIGPTISNWDEKHPFSICLSLFNKSIFKCKSSLPDVFFKKDVLKNFAKFTGKHLFWRLFEVSGQQLY